jgi:hypothetical protein
MNFKNPNEPGEINYLSTFGWGRIKDGEANRETGG